MEEKIAIDMKVDEEAGTVTFKVEPAKFAPLVSEFLAAGLDIAQGRSTSTEEVVH